MIENYKEIADKANGRIRKRYPSLVEPIKEWMVKEILECQKMKSLTKQ